MIQTLSLDGRWLIRGFDGQQGYPDSFCREDVDERFFIPARVPGAVHLDRDRAGRMADVRTGTTALAARWVEEYIWVYRRRFTVPAEAVGKHAWLVFEGLDLNAIIYLNGQEAARHENSFRPLRVDVTGRLREGENTVAVRIESGLYGVSEKSGAGYSPALDHMLHKRTWLRKPQCQFSWDWNPRLVNVGLQRPVRLEWTEDPRIDQFVVFSELSGDHSRAVVHARAFVDNLSDAPVKAQMVVRAPGAQASKCQEVELPAGLSCQEVTLEIENPRLWWPRPYGEPHLYRVSCELNVNGQTTDRAERRTGIRSVRINQDAHPAGGRYFILEVNGKPIFARGGNWVPPDMVYGRIKSETYRRLVEIAVEANFNALRVWGGGLYADHELLNACDEYGVIVWHDFVFACAKYPADDDGFMDNVRQEVTFNVRDLAYHPSLLVWCGNNEIEWGYWDWGFDRNKPLPDHALYHLEIPRILKREDPLRPYWPSSPFSMDGDHPTDATTGDQHPWGVTLGEDDTNIWAYRAYADRFPNEGGVMGASSPATLRQFLPEGERELFSPSWQYHDNSMNFRHENGTCYRMVEDWLGLKPSEMSLEDYAYASALLQAEGLREYSGNYRRRKFDSSCAIFWMFNDSWPVTHGWTIVDYYLRRKLAFHPVRRAFQNVYVIPVIEGDRVAVYGVNDTLEPWQGETRFGLFAFAGDMSVDQTAKALIPANARALLGEFPLAEWQRAGFDQAGAFALLLRNGTVVAQNRLLNERFRLLKLKTPEVRVQRQGKRAVFSAEAFVWGVTLDEDGGRPVADDVFDLIPGVPYSVPWPENEDLPRVQRTGNALVTR